MQRFYLKKINISTVSRRNYFIIQKYCPLAIRLQDKPLRRNTAIKRNVEKYRLPVVFKISAGSVAACTLLFSVNYTIFGL